MANKTRNPGVESSQSKTSIRIPQFDDRHLGVAGFAAEKAERRRAEQEMLPFDHRQPDPSHGQDTPEMAVREERDVSIQRAEPGDEPVRAVGNLGGHFTARTTVPKEIPVRPRFANVHGVLSFVIAIVPLRQVRFDFGRRRPNPASSHVRRARCRGLVNTWLNVRSRSRSPSLRASCSPCPVNGMSVRLVCRLASDHSVSPCRMR